MAKKEKKDKAPKAPKATKAKKKPQFNTEQGGLGKVFKLHGEKMGFVVMIAAAIALIYLGWTASNTLAPDTSKVSPTKIRELAKNASANIAKTPPEVVVPPTRVSGITGLISDKGYGLIDSKFPGPKPTPRSIKPRKDPDLFPPIKPEVIAVTAAIAAKKENPDQKDPLSILPDWKERGASNEGGAGPGGQPGGPPGGRPGGPGGRPGGPGGGGIGGGGIGGIGAASGGDEVGLLNDGYIPVGGELVKPETKSVIILRMLVPNERQMQEYKDKFDGTDEPTLPNILGFQVERQIVTGPNDKEAKWELRDSSKDLVAEDLIKEYGWEGTGPIVADGSVYHPNLTMPMPPIIGRKFDEISLHSETPRGMSILTEPEKPKEEKGDEERKRNRGDFDIDPNQGGGGGLAGGGSPFGGASPYGRGGAPGMIGGRRPGSGDGDDGMGGGMGMPPPGGMMGGSLFGSGLSSVSGDSKYYLLRYCDVEVEAGKQYRYRVRVVYEDPNKPMYETYGTRPDKMDNSVLERQHKEAQEAAKTGKKHQPNLRYTDWSEPTPAAKVSDGNYAFAGPTGKSYANVSRIPGAKLRFFGIEPAVQMLPVVYDAGFGVDVYPSDPVEVQRGAVLDMDTGVGTRPKKVIHPITRAAKQMEDYPSNTGITVIDILGGETIATKTPDTEVLLAPLDVMIVDQSGHVAIRNDMADDADFHKFVPREEPKRRSEMGGGIGGPPGGFGGPPGSGDDGEGSRGGGRPGKR